MNPWALRTKVRYLYDAHQRRLRMRQEPRELRPLVKELPASESDP